MWYSFCLCEMHPHLNSDEYILVVQDLTLAAEYGDKEKVVQCLKEGANINCQTLVSFKNNINISRFRYFHSNFIK